MNTPRRVVALLPAALLAPALACSEGTSVQCSPHPPFSIVATVTDSTTGAAAAQGTSAVAVDGAVRDTLVPVSASRLENQSVRPGTYVVTVRKAGYRDWVRDGVEVRERGDVCRIVSADPLTVRLQPTG